MIVSLVDLASCFNARNLHLYLLRKSILYFQFIRRKTVLQKDLRTRVNITFAFVAKHSKVDNSFLLHYSIDLSQSLEPGLWRGEVMKNCDENNPVEYFWSEGQAKAIHVELVVHWNHRCAFLHT